MKENVSGCFFSEHSVSSSESKQVIRSQGVADIQH